MPPNLGRLNPGIEYQFKVITYTAVSLSENPNLDNFVIYTNKEDVPGFDDIIAKVWYKNQKQPFVYLGQIKHRSDKVNLNNKANNIKKYRDDIKAIFANRVTNPFLKELFENVPEENVEFWFFCSKSVLNTKNSNPIIVDGIQYDVIPDKTYKSIFGFTKDAGCYKLIPDGSTSDVSDFDKLYLLLDQPDNKKINEHILKCDEKTFTKETTTQIIAYTTEYLQTPIGSRGLRKDVFGTQLLRLCLSPVTIAPTETSEIYGDLAWVWNKVNLEYDVTIVDQGDVNMKPYLFGVLFKVLKKILNCFEFDWNDCVRNSNKLPADFNFQKFMELTKREKTYHWLSRPDVLDTLLVEMWKCDYIPLILSSDCNISILTKYQHLRKKFIVMDIDYKISNKIRFSGLRVYVNMDDIQENSLRRRLLEGIHVSLQGREPVRFANVVDNHKNIMNEIRCSHLLNLMKKIKIFVKKECFEHGTSLVFIISHDTQSSKEVSDDWRSSLKMSLKSTCKEENVIIYCESNEVEKHITEIKYHPNLKGYSRYYFKRQYPSGRLEYVTGDLLKIKYFLTDEIGNEINFQKGKLTPIIGTRLCHEEDDQYIPRYLRKATIKNSLLDFEEERIFFLTGNINVLQTNIKKKLIKEFCGDIKIQIEKRLTEKKSAFVVVEKICFEEYWSMFSSNNYPIFYIEVMNTGALVLLKYKNSPNLTSYMTYEGQKFQDKYYFEETTNGVSIITGEAGLGKTTLLHFLFERYDKCKYVLFCDLIDYLNELKQGSKSQLLKKPLKYILSRCEYSISSNALLSNDFFSSLCDLHHRTSRLLLIMDSFDEVLGVHKQEVLELVKSIANNNIRVIIPCKSIAECVLINNFGVQSVKMEYLDTASATKYLQSRKLTVEDITSTPEEFLENPLYLKFLTTLPKDVLPRRNPNNIFNLYRTLIEKKIDQFCKKWKHCDNSTYQREDYIRTYKLFALAYIFGKELIEDQGLNYDDLLEEYMATYGIDLGIVIRFDDDLPIFAHRRFAEFLVALWIYENLNTIPAQKIYKRLLDSNERNIRLLLDNYLCENLKLHLAILSEDLQLVEILCEENKDYLQDMDDYNRTPLHLAASCCKDRPIDCNMSVGESLKYKILDTIVRHMNKEKFNFNHRDLLMKWTWFEYIKGNKKFFEVLCRHGLSATLGKYLDLGKKMISERDIDNALSNNQLHTVVELLKHCPSLVKKFFDKIVECSLKENQVDPVLHLIELQNYENEEFNIVRRICQNMSPATSIQNYKNFRVNGEFTALHLACMYANLEVVKQLVKLDTNLDSLDKFKNTPLHYCVMQDSSKIVSRLVKHISDRNTRNTKYLRLMFALIAGLAGNHNLNIENSLGRTPLHIALMKGNQDVVQILIRSDADIDSCNENGNTLLHFAALYRHGSIFKKLLENGANVHAKDNNNNTAMHHAARVGSVDILDTLLAKDVDINIKGYNGNTALHNAVLYDQINATKLLIEKGANTNTQNDSGNTVLHSAILAGRIDMIELLLENGADVNLIGYNGRNCLHMAAYSGQTNIFRIFVDKCADINLQDKYGDTALHGSVQTGHTDIVQILLRKKADINSKGCDGNTPLITAVHFDQTNILEILLDNGADVNIRNDKDDVALHIAARKGEINTIKLLLKKGDINLRDHYGLTALCLAAYYGHANAAEVLLKNGADLNIRTDRCNTALHVAACLGVTNVVEMLLKQGMGVDLRGFSGNTPLCCAAYVGHRETLELLLENGADINARNDENCTALYLAVEQGKTDIVEILMKKGVDLNLRCKNGNTLLCIAAYKGHTDLLELLLENGADINIGNDKNNTTLHLAARTGKTEVIKIILKNGMDVNLRGSNGNTPLCMAEYTGQTDALELLVENGADISLRNNDDNTILHLAARQGKTEDIKILLKMGMDVNLRGFNGNTPLCIAAYKGRIHALEFLLENGADVSIRNDENDTSLHLAARDGTTEIIEILLKMGMDVNLRGRNGNTPLFTAAFKGNRRALELLLENGADISIRADDNSTALHLAALEGNTEIVEILLKQGMDVNVRGFQGNTSLGITAYNGRTDTLRFLLENGADITITNDGNCTALWGAAQEGKTDVVEILLEKGANLNLRGYNGNTPLCAAACNGHTDTLALLLEHGVELNSRNDDNDTALHLAAQGGTPDIVEILLKKGMDVNLRGSEGNTPLCAAACQGQIGVLELLLENGADISIRRDDNSTALHIAAQGGNTDIVEILLKKGMDVNLRGSEGNTPLCAAARQGQIVVLELLLENGADINIRRDDNSTALHIAAQGGNTDIVEILLKQGMEVNVRGFNGNTPLGIAAYNGQTDTLRFLLENGADITITNDNNCTALWGATQQGKTDVVEMLLKKGTDLNLRGYNGNTPLCVAAGMGQTDTLALLLEHGVELDSRNDDNNTALHLAAQEGTTDIVEILLKKGMDVNLRGSEGNTPLCVAAYEGQIGVVELLLHNGADVNIRNEANSTALYLAALEGNTDIAEILLKKRTDINLRDFMGQTVTLGLLLEHGVF